LTFSDGAWLENFQKNKKLEDKIESRIFIITKILAKELIIARVNLKKNKNNPTPLAKGALACNL